MLREGEIREAIRFHEDELARIREWLTSGTAYEKKLADCIDALKLIASYTQDRDASKTALEEAYKLIQVPIAGLPVVSPGTRAASPMRRNKFGRKPDVQIIEEIVREVGPKHVTDLVPLAETRGVVFGGKKAKTVQLKDKLTNCQRFHNFGSNVWGLPGQEIQPHMNGQQGQRQLIPAN